MAQSHELDFIQLREYFNMAGLLHAPSLQIEDELTLTSLPSWARSRTVPCVTQSCGALACTDISTTLYTALRWACTAASADVS
eukprot:357663-Chlamydomonas_euryale.AAC.14